jgi:hypothetical protein
MTFPTRTQRVSRLRYGTSRPRRLWALFLLMMATAGRSSRDGGWPVPTCAQAVKMLGLWHGEAQLRGKAEGRAPP